MRTLDFRGYHFKILLEIEKSRVIDWKSIKRKLRADVVIQDTSQTRYLFLEYIPDIEPIEETNEI